MLVESLTARLIQVALTSADGLMLTAVVDVSQLLLRALITVDKRTALARSHPAPCLGRLGRLLRVGLLRRPVSVLWAEFAGAQQLGGGDLSAEVSRRG